MKNIEQKVKRWRYLGIDDAPFGDRRGSKVLVVGAVCRGTVFEGLVSTHIRKDGWNASRKISEMICKSKFHRQLHVILLDGIAVGGLNIVDLPFLHENTGLPVVTVMRKKPDLKAMENAFLRLPKPSRRMSLIERAGPVHDGGKVFFQAAGLSSSDIRAILSELSIHGHIPEPVRLAHLIARGVTTGESGKRA